MVVHSQGHVGIKFEVPQRTPVDICEGLSSRILTGTEYCNEEYWEATENIDLEMEQQVGYWEGVTKRKFYNYILIGSKEAYRLKNQFKYLMCKGDISILVRSLKEMRAEDMWGRGRLTDL